MEIIQEFDPNTLVELTGDEGMQQVFIGIRAQRTEWGSSWGQVMESHLGHQ